MIDDDDTSIFLRVGGLQPGDHSDELHLPKTSSIFLHMLPILQPGDIHKIAGDALPYYLLRSPHAAGDDDWHLVVLFSLSLVFVRLALFALCVALVSLLSTSVVLFSLSLV